jgi:hypothetical protein
MAVLKLNLYQDKTFSVTAAKKIRQVLTRIFRICYNSPVIYMHSHDYTCISTNIFYETLMRGRGELGFSSEVPKVGLEEVLGKRVSGNIGHAIFSASRPQLQTI